MISEENEEEKELVINDDEKVFVIEGIELEIEVETFVVSVFVEFMVSDVVETSWLVTLVDTKVSEWRVTVVIDDEKKEKFGFVDLSTLEFCADETDAVDMVKDTVGICLLVDLMETEVEVPSLLVVRVDTMVSDGRLSVVINDEG